MRCGRSITVGFSQDGPGNAIPKGDFRAGILGSERWEAPSCGIQVLETLRCEEILLEGSEGGEEIVSIRDSGLRGGGPEYSTSRTTDQRADRLFDCPKIGTTPSCCIMPRASQLP